MWINPRENRSTAFMPGGSETVARQSNELGGEGGHFRLSDHVQGGDGGDQLAYGGAGTGGNFNGGGEGGNAGGGDGGNTRRVAQLAGPGLSLGLTT